MRSRAHSTINVLHIERALLNSDFVLCIIVIIGTVAINVHYLS